MLCTKPCSQYALYKVMFTICSVQSHVHNMLCTKPCSQYALYKAMFTICAVQSLVGVPPLDPALKPACLPKCQKAQLRPTTAPTTRITISTSCVHIPGPAQCGDISNLGSPFTCVTRRSHLT